MTSTYRTPPPPIAAQPAPHNPQPAYNPWLIRTPILFLLGVLLLGAVLLAALAALRIRYSDQVLPNVWAYGINLGGMTEAEAVAALSGKFTYDDEAVFTFRDGDKFWQLTAGELGVRFDAAQTAAAAAAVGHSGDWARDVVAQGSAWLNGRSIAPIVTYDQNVAAEKLAEIAVTINRAAQDATLTRVGYDVTTTPSTVGRTLDIATTLARLDVIVLGLNTGAEIPLVVHETPPTLWETDSAAARIRAALAGPITVTATDLNGAPLGPWLASVDQINALLNISLVNNADGTRSYAVSVDINAFEGFLQTLAPGLISQPVDGRFHFDEATRQLVSVRNAVDGRRLNVGDTLIRLEGAVFAVDNRTVPLAFDYLPARYHNNISAEQLGITQLVSEATTYYRGSTQARRANIAEAASRYDGIIIGPNEEFSYNAWLGDVSPEAGFVEGYIIQGGRTVKGVGGGVCQVSTTAFQAAFYAGFPILERYAHGYRVGYYESGEGVGMDAAIYTPDFDFRFLNDTPYHLLMQVDMFPAQDAIRFRFYSTNPGRRVVKEGPVITGVVPYGQALYEPNAQLTLGQELQVDWAADGADVTVTRIILDLNGNEIKRDSFFSHYMPWRAIIQVAPGDPRLAAPPG